MYTVPASVSRGSKCVVTAAAVGRELVGFIWAIACTVGATALALHLKCLFLPAGNR